MTIPLLAFIQELGPPELVFILVIGFLFAWPAWRIFKKAGFPGPLGLLMLVPIVNILMILFLAFAPWPALKNR